MLFTVSVEPYPTRVFRAKPLEVIQWQSLSAEVTACATGRRNVYLVLKDGGVVKLTQVEVRQQGFMRSELRWQATRWTRLDGPKGPVSFTSLAVGEVDVVNEVLYAVAGDEHVYRFSEEGRPDRRIDLDLPRP